MEILGRLPHAYQWTTLNFFKELFIGTYIDKKRRFLLEDYYKCNINNNIAELCFENQALFIEMESKEREAITEALLKFLERFLGARIYGLAFYVNCFDEYIRPICVDFNRPYDFITMQRDGRIIYDEKNIAVPLETEYFQEIIEQITGKPITEQEVENSDNTMIFKFDELCALQIC